MPFAGSSYFSRASSDSTRAYGLAGLHSSYMYYNNMSWSFWAAALPSTNKNFASLYQESSNLRCWIFSTQDAGTFRTIFSWDGTNFSLHTTSGVVLTGAWNHYCVTYNNGVQKVYVNAVERTLNQTIALSGTTLFAANVRVMVNSKNPDAPPIDNAISGNFTNFAMFNSSFNQAQVTEAYNLGTTMDMRLHSVAVAGKLTNFWRFDHTNDDTTVIDEMQGSSAITITKSGTTPFFNKSASVPNYSSDPGINNVLQNITYFLNGSSQVGQLSMPNASSIASAVWNAPMTNHSSASTFGQFVQQKILTAVKFLGLK